MSLLRLLTSGGGAAGAEGPAGCPGGPWRGGAERGPPARGGGRGRSFDSARAQRCSLTAFEAPALPHLRRTRSMC